MRTVEELEQAIVRAEQAHRLTQDTLEQELELAKKEEATNGN